MSKIMLPISLLLCSCSSWQASQNTIDLIDTIADIRETQVLRNIGKAIDDPSSVPAQVVLSQGVATASLGISPTFLWPRVSVTPQTNQLNVGGTDSWTSTWQMVPVSSPGDLNRLRNLYAYIVTVHTKDATETKKDSAMKHLLAFRTTQEAKINSNPIIETHHVLQGPNREDVAEALVNGESFRCAEYQKVHQEGTQIYTHWLYWKEYESWRPLDPPADAKMIYLGSYNDHRLYVSSRACLDDFILLVQRSIPSTQTAADQVPRPPSNP